MKRSTARWSTAVTAAAALCLLPATGWTQSIYPSGSQSKTRSHSTRSPRTGSQATGTQQEQQPPATLTASQAGTQQAQEHLQQAKQALNDIQTSSVTGRNRTRLVQLKSHMNTLERSIASNGNAGATATSRRSTRAARNARGATSNWSTEVASIDRILSEMIGPSNPGAATTAGSGEMGAPTGTTGSATRGTATGRTSTGAQGSPASAGLDETTRAKLQEVRTHITQFAAAMSGTAAENPSGAATPSAQGETATESSPSATTSPSSTNPAASSGATAGTTGSMTSGTAAAASPSQQSETNPTTTSQTEQPATPGQSAQAPDPAAAKRHLTEARDTLSQLTQLPAAAQLTGEARTQVSRLITNFNELITAGTNWRDAYGKVVANVNALIGPEQNSAAAGTTTGTTTGSTGTTAGTATGTTGTPGTAGVTGTANINVDPSIRAKLVEFRNHIDEFERAAGGSGSSSSSYSSMPAGTSNPTSSSSMQGTSSSRSGMTGTNGSSQP